jgi:uncharacterized membrane protein YdjX (TVP38/TMEM64 family)
LIGKKWIPLIAIAVVAGLYLLGDGERLLDPRLYQVRFNEQPTSTALFFFIVFVISTALSLPVTAALTVASGMIFGPVLGAPMALLAATLGGSCGFLISRYALHELVQQRFAVQLKVINRGVVQDGVFYLLSMRMIPVIPFWLLNLLMGLTPMRISSFLIATLLGMLPITLVLTHLGSQLGAIQSFTMKEILTPGLMLSLSALALLPLMMRWLLSVFKRRRLRHSDH